MHRFPVSQPLLKEAGATFIAHQRAKDALVRPKNPTVVIPDLAIDDSGNRLTVGGRRIDLRYVGRNHSDNTLVVHVRGDRAGPTSRAAEAHSFAKSAVSQR